MVGRDEAVWQAKFIEIIPKNGDYEGCGIRLTDPEGNQGRIDIKVAGTFMATEGLSPFPLCLSQTSKLASFCIWVAEQLVRKAVTEHQLVSSDHLVTGYNVEGLQKLDESTLTEIEKAYEKGEAHLFRVEVPRRRLGFLP